MQAHGKAEFDHGGVCVGGGGVAGGYFQRQAVLSTPDKAADATAEVVVYAGHNGCYNVRSLYDFG